MPVNTVHPDYRDICKKWNLVRSIVKNNASHWIRTVDSNDPDRSKQYKEDAILTNFTRLTKDGLTGLVFKKETLSEIPQQISYIQEDSTGYKFSLDQLSQKIVGEILQTGRFGLLVDYPKPNLGEVQKVARIKPYAAESIINWDYKDFGNEYKLCLLVLKEDIKETIDGFEWVNKCQYRVLFLDKDGNYGQCLYNNELELIPDSEIFPQDYNGNMLNYIPFNFIGSENDDAWVDSIPLYDLAVVNLGHYKASADLMESMFICGQPVPVVIVGDSGEESFKQANQNGIVIGSRKGVVLPTNGDFKFAQVSPNTLPQQVMMDLEKQAASIGARLISPPGGRETAEAAKIRYGSQNSVLHVITKNVNKGIEEALYWISVFMMEVPEDSVYLLNDQFYEESADPQLIAQQIMLLDRGLMSGDEIRTNLKRSGVKLDDNFVQMEVNPLEGVDPNLPVDEGN